MKGGDSRGLSTPSCLSELRIWLVGGKRLAAALSAICHVDVLRPTKWRREIKGVCHPAFLLVEAGDESEAAWGKELDGLLERCKRETVPRLLWATGSALESYWLERCGHFSRVFAGDRAELAGLRAAGATLPSVLWPAATCGIAQPQPIAGGQRTDTVLWLGGWRREWPATWRERLASVLRGAARRGLHIVAEASLEGMPRDLGSCLRDTTDTLRRETALRGARVVIGADPVIGSPTFAPAVVFDAVACGAAPITPHEFFTIHDFGVGDVKGPNQKDLVPVVRDGDTTAAEIDRLMGDDSLYDEVIRHLRLIVSNNHTYVHRLATLASAVGYRVSPDALDPAPS
jgi:hypothetical protein